MIDVINGMDILTNNEFYSLDDLEVGSIFVYAEERFPTLYLKVHEDEIFNIKTSCMSDIRYSCLGSKGVKAVRVELNVIGFV